MRFRFVTLAAVPLLVLAVVGVDDPWLDLPEAVEYLRSSKKSLYRRVRDRQIRFTYFGNQLRFRRSWLDEYLIKREVQPTEKAN